MSSMDIIVPHKLSKEEALSRIKNLLSETRKEHGDKISDLKEEWTGNKGIFSFSAMGFDVSGELTVNDHNLEMKGTLPMALSFFKGKIADAIKDQATGLLS